MKHHAAIGARPVDAAAFKGDAAVLIGHESGNQVQQRGFAAAGGAQHHQQFAAVQRQVDIHQRWFTAIISGKMRDLQHQSLLLFHETVGNELAIVGSCGRHFALLFEEFRGIDNRLVHRAVKLLRLLGGGKIGIAFD